jgi:hypothetical protein
MRPPRARPRVGAASTEKIERRASMYELTLIAFRAPATFFRQLAGAQPRRNPQPDNILGRRHLALRPSREGCRGAACARTGDKELIAPAGDFDCTPGAYRHRPSRSSLATWRRPVSAGHSAPRLYDGAWPEMTSGIAPLPRPTGHVHLGVRFLAVGRSARPTFFLFEGRITELIFRQKGDKIS